MYIVSLRAFSSQLKAKLSVFLCCLFFAVSSAQVVAEMGVERTAEVEGITEYKLENGLRVLLFPDQTKETVTVNITYNVGSKHENYGETGMAHLLEHLVFKGTPKHKDIPAELSSHGARPNGTTWTDRTNYFETFAATDENINWALSMEASRMVDSFIAKKDLDSEMTVVRNEFERGENNPFRVTLQRATAAAYSWHNYGKSTIGARSDLENVPIGRLKAFYKKYYQPDNATLIVAGKFDNQDMIKRIVKQFGPIPKPKRKLRPLYTQEPAQDGEREVNVRRVGDAQLLLALYHIPSGPHPDYAAIDVLNQILGDTPTGRLHKKVVEGKKASRTFGFGFQWAEPGLAIYAAQADQEFDLALSESAMLEVLENVSKDPITDTEVEKAKRNLLKNIELSFNSSERIALNLSEWLAMGDWRLYFLHRDRLDKVTTKDVQRVAEAYLQRNNRTIGRFIPTKTPERVEIPKVESVAEMVKGYKGKKAIAAGEAFEPSFDNIDTRTRITTLSNGVEMALLSKKTRGESVVATFNIDMGTAESLKGLSSTGSAVGSMLMRGTKNYTREELQEEFDKLKSSVQIGGSAQGATASVITTKENLLPAIRLMTEVLKEPSFSKKEFELYKSTLKVDLQTNLQDPQAIAFNEYSRRLNPYPKDHPRYIPTIKEQLERVEKLKHKDLKKFHERFYGASNMQISVIGDFDEGVVSGELEKLFGNWKSEVNYKRVANPFHKLEVRDQEFNTPDKENAVFVAVTSLPIGENHEDAAALELGNYILGGGFLNSRLATRLRQNDGLSYGAGSFIGQGGYDKKTSMGAYAICAPQNLAKVERGFKEELQRVLDDGFTDDEINNAKTGLLQGKKVSRSQDQELVGRLVLNLDLDRNMQWYKNYESRMTELTADDVKRAMNKYIKLENFSIIKAGDMSKVEAID